MTEPASAGIGLATIADPAAAEATKVAGNLATRLLGPSADVLGEHWAAGLKRRLQSPNAQKVALRAIERTPVASAWQLSPRLGASVLDAAEFADEAIVAEYLSGVLASSADGSNADRGLPWSALIARMSTDALRLHYILFSAVRAAYLRDGVSESAPLDEAVYVSMTDVFERSGWSEESFFPRLNEAIGVLVREALIYDKFDYGAQTQLDKYYPGNSFPDPNGGVIIAHTVAGSDLYLWGLGAGGRTVVDFIDPNLALAYTDELPDAQHFLAAGFLATFDVSPDGGFIDRSHPV